MIKHFFVITLLIVNFKLAAQDVASYQLVYKKGQVQIYRQDKLIESKSLIKGDKLVIGKNSLAIVKNAQATLKLTEDSEITLLDPAKEAPSQWQIIRGALMAKVSKGPFKVRSKKVSMGVRGTEFFASVNNDDLWMCVNEGKVWVEGKNAQEVKAPLGIWSKAGEISDPKAYAWTKKINWDIEGQEGILPKNFKIENSNYKDLLNLHYD